MGPRGDSGPFVFRTCATGGRTLRGVTIALTVSQTTALGNGVNTAFPTGYSFRENSDLLVEVAPAGGAYATKALGVDYNVSGAGNPEPGGTVTFTAAPANLASVRITRVTPRTQYLDLLEGGDFLPDTHEALWDHLVRQIQEQERRLAALEAGNVAVNLAAALVTDGPFVCGDPYAARNVACVGTPTGVFLARVQDNTDGTLVHYGLGAVEWTNPVANQFTARYVPGLTPGHSYTIKYLVVTI